MRNFATPSFARPLPWATGLAMLAIAILFAYAPVANAANEQINAMKAVPASEISAPVTEDLSTAFVGEVNLAIQKETCFDADIFAETHLKSHASGIAIEAFLRMGTDNEGVSFGLSIYTGGIHTFEGVKYHSLEGGYLREVTPVPGQWVLYSYTPPVVSPLPADDPTTTPYPTYTPLPTYTPYPTYTPLVGCYVTCTPTPTETQLPTETPTPMPTATPIPWRVTGVQVCENYYDFVGAEVRSCEGVEGSGTALDPTLSAEALALVSNLSYTGDPYHVSYETQLTQTDWTRLEYIMGTEFGIDLYPLSGWNPPGPPPNRCLRTGDHGQPLFVDGGCLAPLYTRSTGGYIHPAIVHQYRPFIDGVTVIEDENGGIWINHN